MTQPPSASNGGASMRVRYRAFSTPGLSSRGALRAVALQLDRFAAARRRLGNELTSSVIAKDPWRLRQSTTSCLEPARPLVSSATVHGNSSEAP
jgi:hypothetical protein